MKRSLGFLLVLGITLYSLLLFRISRHETALINAINQSSYSNNKASVEDISIGFFGADVRFKNLSIPITAHQSVQSEEVHILPGFFNMLRMALLSPKAVFESGEKMRVVVESPFIQDGDHTFSLATRVNAEFSGSIEQAFQSFVKKTAMSAYWKFSARFDDFSYVNSDVKDEILNPNEVLYPHLDFDLSYDKGLRILNVGIKSSGSNENNLSIKGSVFFDLISILTKPTGANLNVELNGKMPIPIPVPDLKNSVLSASDIHLNADIQVRDKKIQKTDATFAASDLFWTPPSVWPPALAPAYMIYGANPSPVKIDSVRFIVTANEKSFLLDEVFLSGSVLQLNSEILIEKSRPQNPFQFIDSWVDIYFRNQGGSKLAQMMLNMSGNKQLSVQKQSLRFAIQGTTEHPQFRER